MKNLKLNISLLLCLLMIISCAEKKKEIKYNELESSASADINSTIENFESSTKDILIEKPISISYEPFSEATTLILNDSPKELIKEVTLENEDSDLIYNIPPNCNRIGGNSWRCCGRVIISRNGRISSTITTSSNNFFRGFTGAMMIVFYDEYGQPLFEIQSHSYGVNREESKTNNWSQNLEKWKSDLINISSKASVYGIHTPTGRTGDLFARRALKALEAYAKSKGVNVDLS